MTIFVVLLAVTAAIVLFGMALAREIRSDGYGQRPPPRSRADEDESREVQLARLAR
ncbi:MAG: hypothetical protein H0V48_09020 [Nocardioidaceae bacterium]|nr:hypothetical protein [Nocardioidaceae bacterium]MDQ3165527.1 hypothetical protein [Actinomycetota bacterium]